MARMLQALKNLEARSPRPTERAAPKEKSKDSSGKQPPPSPAAEKTTSPQPPPNEPARSIEETPTAKIRPARRPDAPPPTIAPPELTMPIVEAPKAAEEDVISKPAPAKATEVKTRPACRFERQARRLLDDPVRAKPLLQLAERLKRDAEQTGSKMLALVGVGPNSPTHETLLHAALALADKAPGEVLLVDADWARRPLSEALECGQEPGLGELLENPDFPGRRCRPTSSVKLSFLPAGKARQAEISAAGQRLEKVLHDLTADYSYVLLDAGRTSDSAAAVVAHLADAIYFVVQLGTVEASEAQAALRDFRAAGARVAGCIAT